MDVIDTFVVVCTVVLFCSWGYLIWTNWKGKGYAVRFPPYGYDPCPIGYVLKTNSTGTKCHRKEQTRKITDGLADTVDKISPKITAQSVCDMYKDYQGESSSMFIYDGVPSKYSHKDHSQLKTNVLLKDCCDSNSGSGSCNTLMYTQYLGGNNDDLSDPDVTLEPQ
jgi:hypothetical protein